MRRLVLLLAMGLAACASDPDPVAGEHGAEDVAVPVYTVRGEFVAPVFEGVAATIRHEAVPELGMPAMQMNLRLADPAEIEGLAPGTLIQFRLVDNGSFLVIDGIEPLAEGTALELAPPDGPAPVDPVPADSSAI